MTTPLPDKLSDLELVRAIRALYDGKPERWTQGAYARAPGTDHGVYGCNEYAFCWCLSGAAHAVCGNPSVGNELRLATALGFDGMSAMLLFNDEAASFADIDARLAEAEARLANA